MDKPEQESQQGGQGAQTEPPKIEPKLDNDGIFKHAYALGQSAAEKKTEWLKEVFGTADRAEIEKLVKKPKDNELPRTVLDQIAALQKENETLQASIKAQALNDSISKEIGGSGFNLHNSEMVRTMLGNEYDFKQINGELVAHKKGSDQPVVIDNRFATIKTILGTWAKEPSTSFLFAQQQQVTMPQGAHNGSTLKDGELTSRTFVAALKQSGQFSDAINGKPFDRERVNRLIRK
ncbi:MAG TPA: hypothetical protein PLY93_11725 [Turneriella sp.]|nr:hypothetical protein [Turneriella sp.]